MVRETARILSHFEALTFESKVQFDMFPAVEQYPQECLFTTNFILPDRSKAKLFESNCTGVVDTHFRWMQENSIDGILVQRFYGQFEDESFLQLLNQIRTAAEKYGRSFAVEYDPSPIQSSDFSNVVPSLLNDYANNIAPLMTSNAYLHQDGRPVLELWGFGIDKNKLSAADCATIFHAMRSANPNPYVVLGVQWDWAFDRTQNPAYYDVYLQADVIQPWAVGPYNDPSSYQGFYQRTSISDKALTDRLGIKYAPSITPGGSARNRAGKGEPLGNRYNGTYFEAQLKHMLDLKPFFVFGAMFDEFPESKCSSDIYSGLVGAVHGLTCLLPGTQVIATLTRSEVPPAANPGFLGIDDGMDHNYYLQMAGRYAVRFHELWQ